jgi:Zn-dependent peptidase ImmA (M78 family)
MTVAEEFAHSFLHKNAIENVRSIEDFEAFQNHPDWHKHDRNAKRMAAALLMPAPDVLNDCRGLYTQMIEIAGYGDPESIKKYIASTLAEKYEVSVQTMRIRLNEWPVKITEKIDQAMRDGLDFLD